MNHPKDNAGACIWRRTGPSRTWVTVYDAVKSEMDDDSPYVVVCEAHHTLVGVDQRIDGEAIMRAGSHTFCDECREIQDPPSINEEAARWRKVALLIAALYKHEIPVLVATRLGHKQMEAVANVAGVNPPSEETIREMRKALKSIPKPK